MNLTLILIIALLSLVIGFLGRRKNLGFWGFFFASLMLTPVFGLLLLVVAGPGKCAVQRQ